MNVLFVSGYADSLLGGEESRGMIEGLAFLQKPFTRQALMQKIHEVIGSQSLKSVAANAESRSM